MKAVGSDKQFICTYAVAGVSFFVKPTATVYANTIEEAEALLIIELSKRWLGKRVKVEQLELVR